MFTCPADALAALGDGADPHTLAVDLLRAGLERGSFDRSVVNCHNAGTDSVVLDDATACGQGMIRFFYARHDEHTLDALHAASGHFTLGIHNHRYPLALVPLNGEICNVETALVAARGAAALHEYAFGSALAGGSSTTVHRGARDVSDLEHRRLAPGAAVIMAASDLHTVVVPKSPMSPGTAWMVLEGPSDPAAVPLIYSPLPGLQVSSDGLYLPMSAARARQTAELVLRLAETGVS